MCGLRQKNLMFAGLALSTKYFGLSTTLCLLFSNVEAQETKPQSAREILELFNIGESQLETLMDGKELSPSEADVVAKVLVHLPRLGPENLMRWRKRDVSWDVVAAAPIEYRLSVFHLSGRAKRVEKRLLPPDHAERYEFSHYYHVTVALDDSPSEALIAVRRVPEFWAIDQPIDEPTQADALFMKLGNVGSDSPQLIFAASRLGWFPDRPSEQQRIGASQVALARMGMDIGLWDDVRHANEQWLTTADGEAFYQLLAAVGRPEARQLSDEAHGPLNIVPLLEQPTEHCGEILPVEGIARRVMKVSVSDPDVKSRFGFDHYYEIDLFVSLGDARLRLGNDSSGDKNPVYHNAFPATLVVRRLPPKLKEGENLHELVRAPAVFFKIWTYRSSYTNRFGQLQPAPLFIAAEPQVVVLNTSNDWLTSALVLGALVLALGVAGIIAWMYHRDDRVGRTSPGRRSQANTPPDFSSLTS